LVSSPETLQIWSTTLDPSNRTPSTAAGGGSPTRRRPTKVSASSPSDEQTPSHFDAGTGSIPSFIATAMATIHDGELYPSTRSSVLKTGPLPSTRFCE
jgi:hypothetical protein